MLIMLNPDISEFENSIHPDQLASSIFINIHVNMGVQWLSGRVLDLSPKGRRFEPNRHHCVVVLEQDKLILASY